MSSSLVTLVGENLSHDHGGSSKWYHSVAASDGCVYGIPNNARRVMKFDPKDESTTTIGDDLGNGPWKWRGGVEANNGCIYALPYCEDSILKIDIQRQVVEKVDAELPESNLHGSSQWGQGALGDDGCIYYFPCGAARILKLDPSNDSVSSVGGNVRLAPFCQPKFYGTVKVEGGCLIGLPNTTSDQSNRIMKFDPKEPHTTTVVGVESEEVSACDGNGALGSDGNVYAINQYGKILQIDVANNRYSFVAKALKNTEYGWCGAVTGMDGNIYFIPYNKSRVLKYDITTQQASLIGDHLAYDIYKYCGGALNPFDGKIYCIPYSADQVLSIDTNITTQNNNSHNDIQHGEDDDVMNVVPCIDNHDTVDDSTNGGAVRGAQPTMQRLLQVIEVVDRVRGMDHPHPTLMANADRMAEEFTVLTDRFIEEIQNENQGSNN